MHQRFLQVDFAFVKVLEAVNPEAAQIYGLDRCIGGDAPAVVSSATSASKRLLAVARDTVSCVSNSSTKAIS